MELRSKGQAFIMGSILFSTFVIMVSVSSGPALQGTETNTQQFFSQSLEESTDIFNDALRENRSIENAKRRIYSYNRFLKRKSLEKGVDYQSYDLVVLPGKGNATFINYYPRELDTQLYIDGSWTNRTVAAKQSFSTSFSTGTVEVELVLPDENQRHEFNTSSPRLLKHSVMSSPDERWEDTLPG